MNNKGADQRSLISAFVICLLESIIYRLATSKNFNFLASFCSSADGFESRFVGNPEDRFSRHEAHLRIGLINKMVDLKLPLDYLIKT